MYIKFLDFFYFWLFLFNEKFNLQGQKIISQTSFLKFTISEA